MGRSFIGGPRDKDLAEVTRSAQAADHNRLDSGFTFKQSWPKHRPDTGTSSRENAGAGN